ncbi:MAG: YkgJ family cysteine cluster protein [Pseudomonadota bacterium]|uniref:YkgJ family cysteine cluster protein n=1 Tax=Candidatus Desulfatibia profunda TaxID=2841695 RepID=A0A8J6TK57_9BACT|nr:YkgJ family cysteine cluster protein [Candidatus Desulfatibia profunda]MBL7179994.1 YkgJ family cysteine cluster protein [Desulfobacterales bacterium]
MEIDFKPYFEKYMAVSKMADDVFQRVQKEHPECVTCKIKCADCCHAIFDITLIEAIYINHQFDQKFQGQEREQLVEKSNGADRKVHMIKRNAYRKSQSGKKEIDILVELAAERCRCPLLNEKDLCDLYEYRPITCRLYGIPTSIGGAGHTCGKSGFVKGEQYPSVNLDVIQRKLFAISQELVSSIKTRYVKMAEMLIPVSMALITVYDLEYLGIDNSEKVTEKRGEQP